MAKGTEKRQGLKGGIPQSYLSPKQKEFQEAEGMKKPLCFLAVFLLAFWTVPVAQAASDTCYAAGDVNADGHGLSVGDFVEFARIMTEEAPAPESLYQADLTGDCRVDSADLNLYEAYFTYGSIIFSFRNPFPHYPMPTCCNPTLVTLCVTSKADLNLDGSVTSSDVVLMLNCAFLGTGSCGLCFADLDCDGALTSSDVVQELNYAFLGTPLSGCP